MALGIVLLIIGVAVYVTISPLLGGLLVIIGAIVLLVPYIDSGRNR